MANDYERIAAAIRFIDTAVTEQPGVEEIAAAAGVSVAHCTRLFRRWAGVSPKRFLEFLTVAHAKRWLSDSASVLDAAMQSGLSGPSRLHDHFVTIEAVTPGEYKDAGAGLQIRYGTHASPFGNMLLALTGRGICGLSFCDPAQTPAELARLQLLWPEATFLEDTAATHTVAQRIIKPADRRTPLPIVVSGTNFQIKIWEALLRVPSGVVCTYGQLAKYAGHPGSARATGTAVGSNQIAWLIPCHRVIRSTGATGQYRWGAARKQAMLAWETAHAETPGNARSSSVTLTRERIVASGV